ncbi:MAG: COG4223 family protein [Alphaproteobacteria bacterium]
MAENETPDKVINVEAAPDIHDPDTVEEDHVETGLAARILKVSGILVVGGVLALWLGPKIAPALPSGMAPVAAWLAPGGEQTNADIAALQMALTGMPEPVSVYEIDAMIAGGISTKTAALTARIDALDDGSDTAQIESRLAALELKTDGLRAEMSSLLSQLSDVSQMGGEVSAETAAKLAGFVAVNEGLKAEIEALANRIDGVSATAAQVSTVETNAEAARNMAVIRSSLNSIDVALSAGLPFATTLNDLENAGIVDIPVALADASNGVATMAKLRADFPEAAHAAIRASILASAGDGVFASISAFTKAQVAGRSLTPQDGVGPDAVLSRAEAALKQDDLNKALTEIDALPTAAMSEDGDGAMDVWLANAAELQSALNAFDTLQASLLVE